MFYCNNLKKRDGFTFVEAIIAIVIMGSVALFLISSIPSQYTLTHDSQDLAKATDIAQRYIENVKLALAGAANYDNTFEGSTPPIPILNDITANGYFTVQTKVSLMGQSVREDSLKQVSVSFTRTGSNNLLVELSTVIPKPDSRLN